MSWICARLFLQRLIFASVGDARVARRIAPIMWIILWLRAANRLWMPYFGITAGVSQRRWRLRRTSESVIDTECPSSSQTSSIEADFWTSRSRTTMLSTDFQYHVASRVRNDISEDLKIYGATSKILRKNWLTADTFWTHNTNFWQKEKNFVASQTFPIFKFEPAQLNIVTDAPLWNRHHKTDSRL